MAEKLGAEDRRKARVRRAIRKAANGRPRLSVFRSSKQIYAQVIDDERGTTLAADVCLTRWLLLSAILFAASALLYVVRARRR